MMQSSPLVQDRDGPLRVLVTGADQHQGLAVIRGLGLGGVDVIACGPSRSSLGFYSRFATSRRVYTSPFSDEEEFVQNVIAAVLETQPHVVIPAVESTLVALDARRAELEQYAPLAAPKSETLRSVIDKSRTVELAGRLGVPVPRTANADSAEELLHIAQSFQFPVAIKPRGSGLHESTRHNLQFKVRYARTLAGLADLLREYRECVSNILVQEFAQGRGTCVAALYDNGRPVVLVSYRRDRETPLTGGVSVLRTTIEVDPRQGAYVDALLSGLRWHGVAMVEFKYDQESDSYTLMEINGRFQASTALTMDAGVNLPLLAAHLHAGRPLPAFGADYHLGVQERWLRGDTMALLDHLAGKFRGGGTDAPPVSVPDTPRVVWEFVRGFRPGVRYDEFKLYDAKPGFVEAMNILGLLGRWMVMLSRGALRHTLRVLRRLARRGV